MNIVAKPELAPHTCAVLAIGPSMDDVWIDTGVNLTAVDPHVYISGRGATLIADTIGWTAPTVRDELDERIESLERENHDLELQLAEADKQLSAIDMLASAGFVARKKTGRPRKEEVSNAGS